MSNTPDNNDEKEKTLSDRLETTASSTGPNYLALAGGGAALVFFVGAFFFSLAGDDQKKVKRNIPLIEETQEERNQSDIGFKNPTLIEAEPVDDPQILALQEQLRLLREELASLRDQPVAEVSTDGVSTGKKETPTPPIDNNKLAEILNAIKSNQDTMKAINDRLRNQRNGTVESTPYDNTLDAEKQRLAELEAKRLAEEDAKRIAKEAARLASGGVVIGGSGANATPAVATAGQNDPLRSADRQNAFLNNAANSTFETAYAEQLKNESRLVEQGKIITAVLETAIVTDLPGQLKARVNRDIWSADGLSVLIPKGSTLIGEYDSNINIGQSRTLVAWNRVITTDLRSVNIGSTGIDRLGRGGVGGQVDHHFGLKFEAAFFVSIFSAIGNSSRSNSGSTGASSLQSNALSIADQYLSIPPSIHTNQGDEVYVFVSKDLYL